MCEQSKANSHVHKERFSAKLVKSMLIYQPPNLNLRKLLKYRLAYPERGYPSGCIINLLCAGEKKKKKTHYKMLLKQKNLTSSTVKQRYYSEPSLSLSPES